VTQPPQGPSYPGGQDDPSGWSRPTPPTERIPSQQPAAPTERIHSQSQYPEQATQQIPRAGSPMDDPTGQYPASGGGQQPPVQPYPEEPAEEGGRLRRFVTDPLSIVLILVIVVALAAAGLLGGELYARKRGDTVVSAAVQCVVQDKATVSFGVMPPFLWQNLTKHYSNISVETAGNNIREAKGMKVKVDIDDVRLEKTANSNGTIGSLQATIDWSSDGIKNTVQSAIPLFGGIVSSVKTNQNDGTIELDGMLGSVTAKPVVVDNGLGLQVLSVTGLGLTLPRETVQPALDAFTSQLTKNYPLGIHADSVDVTDSGVTAHFSTQNATIPIGQQDPCFAGV
jgi:LmeA-like phospholipid-binding